jgi:hypothetical protein
MRNPGSVVVQAEDEAARWFRVSRVDWEEVERALRPALMGCPGAARSSTFVSATFTR